MEHKRLTLFAGHYGSGKTNIAVNYAIRLAKEGKKVCIADLDIVNPYFRSADNAKMLEVEGLEKYYVYKKYHKAENVACGKHVAERESCKEGHNDR